MEKLRIHKMKYRNRGMANKKLKGVTEYHVIFKFNTDKEATDFITKVKEWHYGLEKFGELMKTALKDATPGFQDVKEPVPGTGGISNKETTDAFNKAIKDDTKTTNKKPAPAKRKAGRPSKKVVQG